MLRVVQKHILTKCNWNKTTVEGGPKGNEAYLSHNNKPYFAMKTLAE